MFFFVRESEYVCTCLRAFVCVSLPAYVIVYVFVFVRVCSVCVCTFVSVRVRVFFCGSVCACLRMYVRA